MTDFVAYEPGTIQVTNGSKNIVGTGTDFSAYSGGDTIWVDGYPVLLDGDPSSDTAALAKYNYLGTSGSGKSYRWVPLGDLSRAIALDTRLSSYFTSGNLSAEAGLTGAADVISYYTGVGTKAVTAFTAAARTVLDDTTVAAMRTTLFDVSTTVDNRIARYDGTAGALQNSVITVDDSGNVSGVGTLASGAITAGGTLSTFGAASSQTTLRVMGGSAANKSPILSLFRTGIAEWTIADTSAGYVISYNPASYTEANLNTAAVFTVGSGGLLTTSGQIAMPASQNASAGANTWDDYEEGTSTPTILFGGAAVGATYGTRVGTYTKSGNAIVEDADLPLTAKGSSTGAASVGGRPFSALGAFFPRFYFTLTSAGVLSGDAYNAQVDLYYGSATGSTGLTHANFNDTSRVALYGTARA